MKTIIITITGPEDDLLAAPAFDALTAAGFVQIADSRPGYRLAHPDGRTATIEGI